MASAGRVLIIPRGDYDENSTYDKLDLVKYKGTSWLAKKNATGIEPSKANAEYWQDVFEPNIANNLTTETEGYALDARQGKVLNEKFANGVWTPAIKGATVAGNHTYIIQQGTYVKAGYLVVVSFEIIIDVLDSNISGNLTIGGLPFTPSDGADYYGAVGQIADIVLPNGYTGLGIKANGGNRNLILNFSGTSTRTFATADILKNGSTLRGQIAYQVAN